MSFNKKGFTPIHVHTPNGAPALSAYCNEDDLLSEILEPGYFPSNQKFMMRPNSFLKVICKDAIVELVVEKTAGGIVFRDEFFRATDPYKELIKTGKRGGHNKGKTAKKTKLAKTG